MIRFLNPAMIFRHLVRHRHLIGQMTVREIRRRYKGAFLGVLWAFAQPLLLLAVYTFVFSVVFKAKWGGPVADTRMGFAMALFTGILTFNILGETLNLAPSLILSHENYVKKVIFPLEILPVVTLLGVLSHSIFGMIILLLGMMLTNHPVSWTILLLPLVWASVSLFALGWAYFLAAVGVFIRDVQATVGLVVTVLFFMSPIFYSLEAIPVPLREMIRLNPVSVFVEDARRVVLWGTPPEWPFYFSGLGISLIVCVAGFIWFMKSKKAFADVM